MKPGIMESNDIQDRDGRRGVVLTARTLREF